MEPETTEPTEPTEPTEQNPKTELIVEQTDIDKVFSFPVFEQIENLDKSNAEILKAIEAQNAYLIPTEEEQAEQAEMERLEAMPPEERTEEEQAAIDQQEEQAQTETETIIEYLPKIHEAITIQNEKMDQLILDQQDSNAIAIESSIMLSLAVVITIGVKVFIDQITKW